LNFIISSSGSDKVSAISKRSGDEPLVKVYFGNIVGMALQAQNFVSTRHIWRASLRNNFPASILRQ
jgi:hypothetical protein